MSAPAPRILLLLVLCVGVFWPPSVARAGGGPANVLLVVNANSPGSKRVANHYAWLRRIPPSNVLYLDYRGPLNAIPAGRFRKEILHPILDAITKRRLSQQIDAVAYSTDFPTRIDFTKAFPAEQKFSKANRPIASLTGATYLYAYVLAESAALVAPRSNFCVPTPQGRSPNINLNACRSTAGVPSRALRSRYAWKSDGTRAADAKSGVRYLMATMLGVTQGRGNTVEEVIACLDRAAEADFSQPGGTFYFMRRERAPRSTPRHACFQGVVDELRKLGADARIQQGVVPKGVTDVAGLMVGSRTLLLDPKKSRLLPGAIAEHLTSYGGIFVGKNFQGQTPITDLIRAGATGASGTVFEPLAVQAKFPLPTLHLHYRRGCSLAESFYQSVASPYQLLIVGDPLCQPWAERPGLQIEGWLASDALSAVTTLTAPESSEEQVASLRIRPRIEPTKPAKGAFWELYVDGRLRARSRSGSAVTLSATKLGPGWHELLMAGVDPGPIACQRESASAIEVLVPSEGRAQPVRISSTQARYDLGGRVSVSVVAPGAESVEVRQHSRVVATITGERGKAEIDSRLLGAGPIRLQAVAQPGSAASPPLWVRVE